MPRKAAAELAVVPRVPGRGRPEPPADLDVLEQRVWREVVDALPGNWLDPNDETRRCKAAWLDPKRFHDFHLIAKISFLVVSAARRNRSIGRGRLQEYNHPGAILGRCEPAIRLHVVAGHNLIGFRDEAIELLLVPYKIRALHSAGIAVVRKRTGFPSDDIVEVRAQATVAFLWSYGRRCLEGKRSRKKTQTLRPYPKSHIRQGADRSADA